ncbi:MAG TPA: hypothetical protein VFT65_04860, partial [Candidatus Angelobacter sp.]|nr:hypothetical protein [Candidatus Angelobacter sp.]
MRAYLLSLLLVIGAAIALAQNKSDDNPSTGHDDAAALTIYNQSFAVVRQTLPLELKNGINQLEITN